MNGGGRVPNSREVGHDVDCAACHTAVVSKVLRRGISLSLTNPHGILLVSVPSAGEHEEGLMSQMNPCSVAEAC